MPLFHYLAKDGVRNIEGTLDAQSRQEAVDKLHQQGYIPVRVEEKTPAAAEKTASPQRVSGGRIKSKEITVFSRQLASLIKSGVPILRGLRIISEQSDNPALRRILEDIHGSVKEGEALSDTFASYPKIFPVLYTAMVRSGEASGTLQDVLVRVADYRQKEEEIFSRVRAALAYPGLMAFVGAGTIIFMLTFVMPRMLRLFSRLGQELPLPTKILIAVSGFIQQWWPAILLGGAVFVFVGKQGTKTKAQRLMLSRLILRLPVLKDFVQKSELARFSRTLELLVKSRVPIIKAIKITIPTLNNESLREELTRCSKELEEGGAFGKSLEKSKLFPGFMTSLIIVGEESGKLDEALSEIAASYERDTEEAVRILTALIEPLIILVMGLVVGFIVVAMLLPVFQMNMAAG